MVPTGAPGEMKNRVVLSSAGQEFKEALENTWDIRDRLKKSRVRGWWGTWIPHLEQRIRRKVLGGDQRSNPSSCSKAGAESLELFLVGWKGKTEVGAENLREWLLGKSFLWSFLFSWGFIWGQRQKALDNGRCSLSCCTISCFLRADLWPAPSHTVKQKFALFVVSKVGFPWQLWGCWYQGDGKNPRY